MSKQDFTLKFSVDQTPEQVFDAIQNVAGWWSGQIDGETDRLGAEFTYRYGDVHRSKQRVTELVRGKRLVWHVVEAELSFVKDTGEWKGTDIVFEISDKGNRTEVRFTHVGLNGTRECFEDCSSGWSALLNGNLRELIATGERQPDAFAEDEEERT